MPAVPALTLVWGGFQGIQGSCVPQFLQSTSREVAEGPWADWPRPLVFSLWTNRAGGHPWLLGGRAKSTGAKVWTHEFSSHLHQLPTRDFGLILFLGLYPSLSFPFFPKGSGIVLGMETW